MSNPLIASKQCPECEEPTSHGQICYDCERQIADDFEALERRMEIDEAERAATFYGE